MAQPHGNDLSLEELLRELQRDWRSGVDSDLLRHVERLPVEQRHAGLEELLKAELEFRLEEGQAPSLVKYKVRYPADLHPLIESLFPPDPLPEKFRFLRLLGSGAFGKVWRARDLHLLRLVAVKNPLFPALDADRRRAALDSLRNEARQVADVRHPNIVQVLSWESHGDDLYLVMQYVQGDSLDRVLARMPEGRLPWEQGARFTADVAEALTAVHRRGVVHRDVKPANILWDERQDEVFLTDFGCAARMGEGVAAGTPAYMAPEVLRAALNGRPADRAPAVDVFALAATLFTLLTGESPFRARDFHALASAMEAGLPDRDPRCAGMPEAMERILRAALAPNPAGRMSMEQLAQELRNALNHALADTLPAREKAQQAEMSLEILVRRREQGAYVPLATRPATVLRTRDIRRVPPRPKVVELRDGDQLQISLLSSRGGYVSLFNVGPAGRLNLLAPADPRAPGVPIAAGEPLVIVEDAIVEPPHGAERLFAVWTREPVSLAWDRLVRHDAEGAVLEISEAYRATRALEGMKRSLAGLGPEDRHAVVLEIAHPPA